MIIVIVRAFESKITAPCRSPCFPGSITSMRTMEPFEVWVILVLSDLPKPRNSITPSHDDCAASGAA